MKTPSTGSSSSGSPVVDSSRTPADLAVLAEDLDRDAAPVHLDLLVGEAALLDALGRAQLVAAVDQVDRVANLVRNIASSTAASPPPMTQTTLSW